MVAGPDGGIQLCFLCTQQPQRTPLLYSCTTTGCHLWIQVFATKQFRNHTRSNACVVIPDDEGLQHVTASLLWQSAQKVVYN